MDPLTIIVGAIIAGVAAGSRSVTEQAVKDTYSTLKLLINSKFGEVSDVANAVKSIEGKPDSAGRRETLREELSAVRADQDKEVLQVASKLLDLLKYTTDGEKHIQQAVGSYIAQADRGSTATVKVSRETDDDR